MAQLVRHKVGKLNFELMVKPGAVQEYRKGNISWNDAIETDIIFKNQSSGDRAKAADLAAAFETEVVADCIQVILKKGELQLTAAERKEKVDAKKRAIVNYIHKYYVDPRSKLPHPVVRIESAIEELKFRVDGDVDAERQALDLVKKLPNVLPIKKCEIIGSLTVPNKFMGAAQGALSQYATIMQERWDANGCKMEISLVPGDYDIFIEDLTKVTKGEFTFEVEGGLAASSDDPPATRGGKGKRGGGGGGKRGAKK